MLTSEMLPRELGSSTQQNFSKAAFIEVSAMEEKASSSRSCGGDENNNLKAVAGSQKVARYVTTCHACGLGWSAVISTLEFCRSH